MVLDALSTQEAATVCTIVNNYFHKKTKQKTTTVNSCKDQHHILTKIFI